MSLVTIIIDDDLLTCKIHEKLLKYAEISSDPKVFYNALEALDFFHADERIEDDYLIFLDISIPVMDGWTFLEELKKVSVRNYHVVIVSSSVQPSDQERAHRYQEVIKFIVKPMDKQALLEVRAFINENYPAERRMTS